MDIRGSVSGLDIFWPGVARFFKPTSLASVRKRVGREMKSVDPIKFLLVIRRVGVACYIYIHRATKLGITGIGRNPLFVRI